MQFSFQNNKCKLKYESKTYIRDFKQMDLATKYLINSYPAGTETAGTESD